MHLRSLSAQRYLSAAAWWALLWATALAFAQGLYWLGDCFGAFFNPARCTHLPDAFGWASFWASVVLLGFVYWLWPVLLAAIIIPVLLWEIRARKEETDV